MVIVLGFFSERAVSCKGAPSPVGLLYCSLGLWTPGMCANGLDLDICQSGLKLGARVTYRKLVKDRIGSATASFLQSCPAAPARATAEVLS